MNNFCFPFNPAGFPSPRASPCHWPRRTWMCLKKERVSHAYHCDYRGISRSLTRVALPIKVLLGVTVAAQVESSLLSSGAVCEGDMPVSNVVEEVDFTLVEHEPCSNGVDRRISPTLVEETTVLVQRLKVINVLLAAQPLQTANLKVGPLLFLVSHFPTQAVQGRGVLTKWQLL